MISLTMILLFIFLHLSNLLASVNGQHSCGNSGNYTSGSNYQSNLNSLFSSLSTNVDQNGFYNASTGVFPDTVYALVLCRGDLQLDMCRGCVQGATVALLSLCPNQRQAILWTPICMVRYSDESMFGNLATSPMSSVLLLANGSNYDVFYADLATVLTNLVRQVAQGGPLRKVAVGNISTYDFQYIYALGQCTPDLTSDQCTDCLRDGSRILLPQCCNSSAGARINMPSCSVGYETRLFYNETRLLELAQNAAPPSSSTLPIPPPPVPGTSSRFTLHVAGIATPATLLIVGTFLAFFIWKKRIIRKEGKGKHKEIELFLKNNESFAPKRYKYSDLKKITNSFSDRLGKGGFGSVYKGKLQDGRLTAVKLLNELKGNGEDFMNEVTSISRTSHVNIVMLLGFCFEGSKRALVYEFMPNGSLDKYICSTSSSTDEERLGWEKIFKIAFGVAQGLEYLHQGCNTRILHLDIKPHNILLDKDFRPKIADFGLAKLCPDRASIISMLGARGTVGYIAPEVFCRNFGDISHKSDVYSFGMLMLEMVGGRKNVDATIERSSDAYFPDWIYKQLEETADEGVDDIWDEDEEKFVKRKLTIIGLWCIQTDPKHRPTISRVVEMLEGNLESLQIPPKPYLFSPAKLQVQNEASTFGSSF